MLHKLPAPGDFVQLKVGNKKIADAQLLDRVFEVVPGENITVTFSCQITKVYKGQKTGSKPKKEDQMTVQPPQTRPTTEVVEPDRITCPRCARSVILCPCHVVPGRHGFVWVLNKEQYKQWKATHKHKKPAKRKKHA